MNREPMDLVRTVCLTTLMVMVFGVGAAPSQDCPELVGRVPYGPARAVDAVGDHVYYSSGSMLMIANVSNPAAPVVVGEIQMPELIRDITVSGGFAHVVCGPEGYSLVDVGVPSAPVYLGSYLTGPIPGWSFAGGVAVSGDLVYVADGSPGLTILDVSQPGKIQYVSEVVVLNSYSVQVRESYAYLAGYDGLRVVDISNPEVPVVVGSTLRPIDGPAELAVVGDFAYVAGYVEGLRIFNISSPTAPVEVNAIAPPFALDVVESNGLLYVVDAWHLSVYELTDPVSPSRIGEVEIFGIAIAVEGDLAHLAGHDTGLHIVDVTEPSAPAEVAVLGAPDWTLSVAASGSLLAAPGSGDQLRVFDIGHPAYPVEIGVADSVGPFRDLEIVGAYVFVANLSSFRVIDISDPTAPVDLGSTGRSATGLDVSGDYVYLASYYDKLTVMEISNPGSPSYRGQVTLPDSAERVAVTADHAYVSVYNHGLQIIDVSDPSHPSLVAEYGGDASFSDVAAAGNLVFVAGSGDLRILDVTSPASPVERGLYDPDDAVSRVNVSGNYAYVGGDRVTALDVSDPDHPHPVGQLQPMEAPGGPEQIKVDGDFVYLAHYIGGVSIIRGCHALFVDGFESGDTSAWSSATAGPGSP